MNNRSRSPLGTTLHSIAVIAPWLLRGVLLVFAMMAVTAITFGRNIPQTVERMINEWLDRAYFAGAPTDIAPTLAIIFRIAGWFAVVLGWIFLAYLTVALVNVIL